jgi:hypothetical protein
MRVSAGFWVIGLSGKDADPDLSTALHCTHDRTAGSFDLAGSDPGRFQGLQAKITKMDFSAALGFALHAAAHLLAPFNTLWHQHNNLYSLT